MKVEQAIAPGSFSVNRQHDVERLAMDSPTGSLPGLGSSADYPRDSRRPFFSHWYLNRLFDDRMGNQIGIECCWLLAAVVSTEDRLQYQRGVDFFNGQLEERCGFSTKTLINARKKSIENGLLHYEPSTKRRAGMYWVIVPEAWIGAWDEYILMRSVQILHGKGNERGSDGEGNRRGKGLASSPIPSPIPKSSTTIKEAGAVDLEIRLLDLGVTKAHETVMEALAHGTTLEVLNDVVEYFESRPGAWQPGGLRNRLTLGSAQRLPPDRGWPAADRSQEAKEKRLRSAIVSERDELPKENLTDTKAKYKQLELKFGEMLNSLSPAEQEKLLADNKPTYLKHFRQFGAGVPLVRGALLESLSIVAECSK
jgi:hypothetical protein